MCAPFADTANVCVVTTVVEQLHEPVACAESSVARLAIGFNSGGRPKRPRWAAKGAFVSNLPYVLKHVKAGARIRFCKDFYFRPRVIIRRKWLPWPARRVALKHDEVADVRRELVVRRRGLRTRVQLHGSAGI